MNLITRKLLMEEARFYYKKPLMKIFHGIRGAGKTTLFKQIMADLKETGDADEENILYFNFEYLEFEKLRDAEKLEKFIRNKVVDNERLHYLFLDELQYVPHFEKLLMSLIETFKCVSIFVASSTSHFSPKYLNNIGLFGWRYFYVAPLSYIEASSILNVNPMSQKMIDNYFKYGAFPARFQFKRTSEIKSYLYTILDACYYRSIILPWGYTNIDALNIVLRSILKYIGQRFMWQEAIKEMIENNPGLTYEMADLALEYLNSSLFIFKIDDFDLKGKMPMKSYENPHYYLCDFGFAFIMGYNVNKNIENVFKNIVFLELKRRGYIIYTGLNGGKEQIDFVAERDDKRIYVHTIYYLEDIKAVNEAIEIFDVVKDDKAPKYLVTMNSENYSRNGVTHKYFPDFVSDDSIHLKRDDYIVIK